MSLSKKLVSVHYLGFWSHYHELPEITIFSQLCYCSGTRIKTRKRNIAAPLDPAAFSDAVVQIYLENAGDLVLINLSIYLYFCGIQAWLCFFLMHPWPSVPIYKGWVQDVFGVYQIKCLLCRNLLQRALNLQTLISIDTVTPFSR